MRRLIAPQRLPARRLPPQQRCYHDDADPDTARGRRVFTRRTDDAGTVYYTVATQPEGKDMPHPPRRTFEMPDLVLDLDAETVQDPSSQRVRDFSPGDEEVLARKWDQSPRQRVASLRSEQLASLLVQARTGARSLRDQAAHPMHTTDCDVLSVAMRGVDGVGVDREPELPPGQWHITRFSNVYRKEHEPPLAQTASQTELAEASQIGHSQQAKQDALHHLACLGDPRRRPDYMRQHIMDNGIPAHAADNDERLLRWMLLRRRTLGEPPTPDEVASAIRGQGTQRHSVGNIRRVVFGAVARGTPLDETVVDAVHGACTAILDRYEGDSAAYYEVLTLANNMAARSEAIRNSNSNNNIKNNDNGQNQEGGSTGPVRAKRGEPPAGPPEAQSMARGIATCVSGLRIRALAGLGLAEQTVLHLGPTGDVGADVYAAMGSWERHLDAGHLDAPARQALFCALTGFNAAAGQAGFPDGSTGRASYKRHLLDPRGLERYAHLLGRLGATATLRAERALGPGSGGKELDLDVAMADDYARIGGCHSHA